jgi:glycerophosphoryl diester phosphodiesterase
MRPLLLGHRGARASRHVAENTLRSFELCLQHGCDGFEFDVRRSIDGVAVVCHDPVISGLEIEKTPASTLGLPNIGLHTLSDVFNHFSARAFLDIELKVAGLETQLIAALHQNPPQKGYVVSSFLPEVLDCFRDADPGIPLGFLSERAGQLPPPGQTFAWIIPEVHLLDQARIERLHTGGQKAMAWTVNRAEQMKQLTGWGVDAIISDETELLVRSLR